ncbi:hypothetical protein P4388_24985 [Bacillus thuringiensis]|uniref:hypothetical protein n=1 Tax=Bacillus cereus group TaxID=86661 RepID=UPI000A3C1244|nr:MULTISPECIES: hypothetical protein [Bacillus cereus group]MEB8647503.1 hypothetical protein [Bacillus cereus]MEB8667289.1 hypothetical protein [Bacillus cereus]MEB9738500.1 hypothetical protein [Bacillus cereus]MED3351834.1 hypothetical protein [Bacillus thuringiensis]MRB12356.1 hypothetical protein [Bacillus thuringiensis]
MAKEKNSKQQQSNDSACTPNVSAEVCVEADITIIPTVEAGKPVVHCVGIPSFEACSEMGFTPSDSGNCNFTVSQVLCINIPISFGAETIAVPGKIACGNAFNGPNCSKNNLEN